MHPAGIPNENITSSAFWLRVRIKNETDLPKLVLKLSNPTIDSIAYYEQMATDSFRTYTTGESAPFAHREYLSSDFLFAVHLQPGAEKFIYLHVYSCNSPLMLPLAVGPESAIMASDKHKDIFWGMYMGLMIAMLLYNGFVYTTTRDNSYLYYLVYMLAVLLTQITISGYAFQLLWPGNSTVEKFAMFVAPVLAGITAATFIRRFLKTSVYVPRANIIFSALSVIYIAGLALSFAGFYPAARNIIDMAALVLSLYILAVAFIVNRRGYRPALFILIAWIVFLAGVFIFIFKNFGLLPYNNFTVYTMPVGSALEALLLSFALADRINLLKKDVEISQANELLAVQENERIVRGQNIMLEEKVTERTTELNQSNEELKTALSELKSAQAQLVASEKMASLGQLTAGIAHEINNPVNFITSNISPLNRDMEMLLDANATLEGIMRENISPADMQKKAAAYMENVELEYTKEEIKMLLEGIRNGAERTAEIVKGLRIFSRLDEWDLKKADLNECLDATLAITSNLFTNLVKLEKQYSRLPMIECYPGLVNQVFLNVISNAVYAIKDKFGDKEGGTIVISTTYDKMNAIIRIKDNGIGMTDAVRKKVFEPFFTTRKVGDGAGLGLSIAFNIISKHMGKIEITSENQKGTEVAITLPLVYTG